MEKNYFFVLGDRAEDAGDFAAARDAFERGVAGGEYGCLNRLAMLFDVGLGVPVDKTMAMRLCRRTWRKEQVGDWATAAANIAILYREWGRDRELFQWFPRAAVTG